MELTLNLSIIIINWNSKNDLIKSIESIFHTVSNITFEIIVIDNASFDGCDHLLSAYDRRLTFIQSKSNLGFSKANNEAFSISKGEIILFLNPDTIVLDNAIENLYFSILSLDHAGIVGPKLLNTDTSIQTSCIRIFPNIINQILDFNFLIEAFPFNNLWYSKKFLSKTDQITSVDAVSGACLMIKRSVFEEINYFSTEYFMYSEDLDICYKANSKNWKTYYIPSANVIHHGGGSSIKAKINTFSDVMMLESRMRFFSKTKSQNYCHLFLFCLLIFCYLRVFLLLSVMPAYYLAGEKKIIKARLSKWISKLRWCFGMEKWLNEYDQTPNRLC